MERARLEAVKRGEIMDQEVNTKKEKAQRREQLISSKKLAIPDQRKLLDATFGDNFSAKCGVQPCSNHVNVTRAWIIAKDDYKAGMDNLSECAAVVCPLHAKESCGSVKFLYSLNAKKLELWLYRFGADTTKGLCGICGVCPLRIWDNIEMCHVVSYSDGGSNSQSNLILGSASCNSQQATESLESFRQRISATVVEVNQYNTQMFNKDHLEAARKELMSNGSRKIRTCGVERMLACVERLKAIQKSKQPLVAQVLVNH